MVQTQHGDVNQIVPVPSFQFLKKGDIINFDTLQ
jgi:hypothetical protein